MPWVFRCRGWNRRPPTLFQPDQSTALLNILVYTLTFWDKPDKGFGHTLSTWTSTFCIAKQEYRMSRHGPRIQAWPVNQFGFWNPPSHSCKKWLIANELSQFWENFPNLPDELSYCCFGSACMVYHSTASQKMRLQLKVYNYNAKFSIMHFLRFLSPKA